MTTTYYSTNTSTTIAVVAQLVEHQLPKLRVAGSSPVYRSNQTSMTVSVKSEKALRNSILVTVATIVLCSTAASCASTGVRTDGGESSAPDSSEAIEKTPSLIDIYTVSDSDTVFICTGKASKRFHSSDSCEGIMQCTKKILSMTRAEAEKRHRTFCHKCYRDSLE